MIEKSMFELELWWFKVSKSIYKDIGLNFKLPQNVKIITNEGGLCGQFCEFEFHLDNEKFDVWRVKWVGLNEILGFIFP